MDRKTYCNAVRAQLRHLTKKERELACAEIDAHMEDHICSLMELGYDAALAEERTMALMGDPEEVGRELNRQYPPGWLLLKWAAMTVAGLLAILLLTQVGWRVVGTNLRNRFSPQPVKYDRSEVFSLLNQKPVDLRIEIGNATVRVCAVGIVKPEELSSFRESVMGTSDAEYLAAVTLCAYSTDWRDLEILPSVPYMRIEKGIRGWNMGSTSICVASVRPGQESITAAYQLYGCDLSMEIPLDWEGVE